MVPIPLCSGDARLLVLRRKRTEVGDLIRVLGGIHEWHELGQGKYDWTVFQVATFEPELWKGDRDRRAEPPHRQQAQEHPRRQIDGTQTSLEEITYRPVHVKSPLDVEWNRSRGHPTAALGVLAIATAQGLYWLYVNDVLYLPRLRGLYGAVRAWL